MKTCRRTFKMAKDKKQIRPKAITPKGFRDYFGSDVTERNQMLQKIAEIYDSYGFEALESSAVETVEALGKFLPDIDQPNEGVFAWQEDDQDWLALRYDLTAPLARVYAQYRNELPTPYRRYSMGPVWRNEKPGPGRFRQFYQCDADAVGSNALWQEVEFIQLYDAVFSDLKLKGVTIKVNNRKILAAIAETIGAQDQLIDFTVALDKLDKIGADKVKDEMLQKGISSDGIARLEPLFSLSGDFKTQLGSLKTIIGSSSIGQEGISELDFMANAIDELGLKTASLVLDVTLARGLNYYTGAIFEVSAPEGVAMGSIGGGGRYDDLTSIFGLKGISGVGISFGLDRIALVLEELDLFPKNINQPSKVLFVNFGTDESLYSYRAIQQLRSFGIAAELYPDAVKLKKQITYANKRNIPYVVLVGDQELSDQTFTVKDMTTGAQETLDFQNLLSQLRD